MSWEPVDEPSEGQKQDYADLSSFEFDFFYDKDLKPIRPTAQTQKVEITITTGSKYPL